MQNHLYPLVVMQSGLLVFKHNEHQLEEAKRLSKEYGFKDFLQFTPHDFIVDKVIKNIVWMERITD